MDDALEARPKGPQIGAPRRGAQSLREDQEPAGDAGHKGDVESARPRHDRVEFRRPVRHKRDLAAGLVEVLLRPSWKIQRGDAAQVATPRRAGFRLRQRREGGGTAEEKMATKENPRATTPERVEAERVQSGLPEMADHGVIDGKVLGPSRRGAGGHRKMGAPSRPEHIGVAALRALNPRHEILVAADRHGGTELRVGHGRVDAIGAAVDGGAQPPD